MTTAQIVLVSPTEAASRYSGITVAVFGMSTPTSTRPYQVPLPRNSNLSNAYPAIRAMNPPTTAPTPA